MIQGINPIKTLSMTADYIAIALSAIALGISVYTLWVVRVSPFKLLVEPPAISFLNRAESSLGLDMTFLNQGRTPAAILDLEITLCDRLGNAVMPPLKPRAFHQAQKTQNGLSWRSPFISHFTPIVVHRGEVINRTICFAPSETPATAKLEQNQAAIDTVRIAFNVNTRWNKKCFTWNYSEFHEYLQQRQQLSALLPFPPRFFPDVKPLFLQGSIFDPVY
jgi:hypothetical protein